MKAETIPAPEPLSDNVSETNEARASSRQHLAQDGNPDSCFGLLGGEAACSQPRFDQCLVSAHRRFDQ
jgi:hypothetical protein